MHGTVFIHCRQCLPGVANTSITINRSIAESQRLFRCLWLVARGKPRWIDIRASCRS